MKCAFRWFLLHTDFHSLNFIFLYSVSVFDIMTYITGHITGESWVDSRNSQEVLSLLPDFQTRSVGPCITVALSSGTKRPGRKAGHSPPSNAEVNDLMA
jgi:hypothetical protein